MAKNELIVTESVAKERRFVHFLMKYGDVNKAAKAAQLSGNELTKIFHNTRVKKLIQEEAGHILSVELIPKALWIIKEMLKNPAKKPDRTLADLCKSILDRVGFGAVKPVEDAAKVKDLASLSIEELESYIKAKEAEAFASAKPIDNGAVARYIPEVPEFLE